MKDIGKDVVIPGSSRTELGGEGQR